MRRSLPIACGIWLVLAFTAAVAADVASEVPGPMSDFGARESVSPAASATYRIEIPSDGAYQMSAVCW